MDGWLASVVFTFMHPQSTQICIYNKKTVLDYKYILLNLFKMFTHCEHNVSVRAVQLLQDVMQSQTDNIINCRKWDVVLTRCRKMLGAMLEEKKTFLDLC